MFKKLGKLIVVFMFFTFCLTACGASSDLTRDKSADTILKEAYSKLSKVKNYEMKLNLDVVANIPDFKGMKMNAKATVFQKPFLMKTDMDMNVLDSEENMKIIQYLEQKENQIYMYQNVDNQWFKMKIDDSELSELMEMDPSKNIDLFLKNLKNVELLGSETINNREAVKLKMVASTEMYKELMNDFPVGDVKDKVSLDLDMLSQMGDIEGIIWVDKQNLNILKTSMDLSKNINNLAESLKKEGELPKEVIDVFLSMKVKVDYEIFNIDKATKITIPEEARNAEELSM